jgi:hypothetical protein
MGDQSITESAFETKRPCSIPQYMKTLGSRWLNSHFFDANVGQIGPLVGTAQRWLR